jgi:uncharacterized protein (TIRG00374 family)
MPVSVADTETARARGEGGAKGRRSWGRTAKRILSVGGPVAIVVAVFAFVLPRFANYGQVWAVIQSLAWWQVAVLLLVALLNLATFGPPWMAALPGLGYWHSMIVTQASTAFSSILPGGDALGAATTFQMLREWGFQTQDVTLALVVFSLWNQLANVGIPLFALLLLTLGGETSTLLNTAALIGGAVLVAVIVGLVLIMRGDAQARRVARLAERALNPILRLLRRKTVRLEGTFVAFRAQSLELVRRRWLALTVTTLVGHLTVFLVLYTALRFVGVSSSEVNVPEMLAAWSLVRLLTAIPLTPGGLGVVELGLTGTLVGFGGEESEVVAGVLIYRFLTYVPPIAVGAVCWLIWARMHARKPGAREVGAVVTPDVQKQVERDPRMRGG